MHKSIFKLFKIHKNLLHVSAIFHYFILYLLVYLIFVFYLPEDGHMVSRNI